MSKSFHLLIFLSIFLIFSFLTFILFPRIGIAQEGICSVQDIGTLPFDFGYDGQGIVTITPSREDCFTKTSEYIVAFYPKSYTDKIYKFSASPGLTTITQAPYFSTQQETGQKLDCGDTYCGQLQGRLNLATQASSEGSRQSATLHIYLQGKDYQNQPWVVVVCSGNSVSACNQDKNIFAQGEFFVSDVVSKAAPEIPNLPNIDASTQDKCTFRSGADNITIKVTAIKPQTTYQWWWHGKRDYTKYTTGSGVSEFSFTVDKNGTGTFEGNRKLCVDIDGQTRSQYEQNCIWLNFIKRPFDPKTVDLTCNPDTKGPSNECTQDLINICKKRSQKCLAGQCIVPTIASGDPCDEKGERGPAIKTAIGCIHTSPAEFIKDFLKFTLAISGGLAFLLMILGAFQMITSAGNPDTLNAGKERLTSAVIGLLFVIFAVLLLQIIGIGILKIPEFG